MDQGLRGDSKAAPKANKKGILFPESLFGFQVFRERSARDQFEACWRFEPLRGAGVGAGCACWAGAGVG